MADVDNINRFGHGEEENCGRCGKNVLEHEVGEGYSSPSAVERARPWG